MEQMKYKEQAEVKMFGIPLMWDLPQRVEHVLLSDYCMINVFSTLAPPAVKRHFSQKIFIFYFTQANLCLIDNRTGGFKF